MEWLAALALAAIAGWAIVTYNRLVDLEQRARQAFSDIDAQLKRRHDLVPALVETVKGYARHERDTLEEVVARRGEARQAAEAGAGDLEARSRRENGLVQALRGLFALAEDYPDLRASDRFGALQAQLAEIENHLQHARRYYNAVVRDLNTRIASFPDLVAARLAGFGRRPFFELDTPLERRVVAVDWAPELIAAGARESPPPGPGPYHAGDPPEPAAPADPEDEEIP